MGLSNTIIGQVITTPITITPNTPVNVDYSVSGNLMKRVSMEVRLNTAGSANIILSVADQILIDNVDVPSQGAHSLNFIVNFPTTGNAQLKLSARGNDIVVNSLNIEDAGNIDFPKFLNASAAIGLVDPLSIKYGGPSITDIDNDGDYDMILNNHNAAPSVLYLNDGDGTVTRGQELSQFFKMDLHGSATGDYDNDGDLDIVIALGGGNGTNPAPPVFYKNDNGTFIRSEADVGITSGARGRSPRWVDFDLDGDLDLALFNAAGINGGNNEQHIFYSNRGDGTFNTVNVPGLENATSERVLITDLNNDHIDDVVMIGPLTVWKGNGDFSFEEVTDEWIPASIRRRFLNISATDIDIDNDGDLDLYIAGGLGVFQVSNRNSIDFNPELNKLDGRTSGSQGTLPLDITATGSLRLFELDLLNRNGFAEDYPVFLGSNKVPNIVEPLNDDLEGGELVITQATANGWPASRTENGIYIGYLGDNQWKFETVRNSDIFFNITFSLEGVNDFSTTAAIANRNIQDFLLRNDDNGSGGRIFTDVSAEWNIPRGGNHWGVTTGDFNNDSFADLYVYRYGFVRNRRSDYLLLNTGQGKFEISTNHEAKDLDAITHGDMGQAFDYDLDGDVDILSGDDEFGTWHLYTNEKNDTGNYAIVKVGYSPISNVDPLSAEVTITTTNGTSQYRRVGSSGEVFSQSLLNMIHFGLGTADRIENITVRWRNGEIAEFNNEGVNQIFDTNQLDPTSLTIEPKPIEVRVGTTTQAELIIEPSFANRQVIWTSEDATIASVDENGVVTGNIEGQSTIITATSIANNSIMDTAPVNVIAFVEIPAQSITLDIESLDIIQGNTATLNATVLPADADDKSVIWSSSDTTIVNVDQNGIIDAVADGTATVTAALTVDENIKDDAIINVSRLIAPSLVFDDRAIYATTEYPIGGTIDVSVDYHAGTGNTVISGNDGGIRFFIRHLNAGFGLIRDFDIQTDATALNTESGTATVSLNLNLDNLPPGSDPILSSAELQNGEFYFLFVSFSSSSGDNLNVSVSPITVIEGALSVEDTAVLENNSIKMFPNPAENYIYFMGLENKKYKVTINNILGQKIFTKKVKGNKRIPISSLKTGMHIVTIESGGLKKTFNLIKE